MLENHEKNQSFGLLELQDSTQEEFQSRNKIKNTNRVNGNCPSSIEFQTRKKAKSKGGYDLHSLHDFPDIHKNTIKGEAIKIKKTRAPKLSVLQIDNIYENKIGVTNDLYKFIGGYSFNIPEELIVEILSRLPLKSLARFKCVSNHWLSLILNDVPMTNNPKLLIISCSKLKNYSLRSLDEKTHEETLCSPFKQRLFSRNKVMAHSSCHGLLLIQIDSDLLVWNPLTNFFRNVLSLLSDILVPSWKNDCFVADLCYCSANDEYKVVLIAKDMVRYWYNHNCYVATCGAKSWEKMDVFFDNVFQGPFFKGYRHWINIYGSDWDPKRTDIVYFDPSTNKFIEMAIPKPKEGEVNIFHFLGVYDECLCVTRWDGPKNNQVNLELLVMKEYGNGNSWEIMFVFSNMREFHPFRVMKMKILLKTKEGEIWVSTHMSHRCQSVKAFDVDGNFLRDIWVPTEDYSKSDDFCEIISYEESWFSPTGL